MTNRVQTVFISCLILWSAFFSFSQEKSGTFTDQCDGNVYEWVENYLP